MNTDKESAIDLRLVAALALSVLATIIALPTIWQLILPATTQQRAVGQEDWHFALALVSTYPFSHVSALVIYLVLKLVDMRFSFDWVTPVVRAYMVWIYFIALTGLLVWVTS